MKKDILTLMLQVGALGERISVPDVLSSGSSVKNKIQPV